MSEKEELLATLISLRTSIDNLALVITNTIAPLLGTIAKNGVPKAPNVAKLDKKGDVEQVIQGNLVRETEKALLLGWKGREAWIPKKAIKEEREDSFVIHSWFDVNKMEWKEAK